MSVIISNNFNVDYDVDSVFVVIDTIRSTTTAITAVESGKICFVAGSLDEALRLASFFDKPLLVGEISGKKPIEFDFNNSPWSIDQLSRTKQNMILLSSSGTPLIVKLEEKYSDLMISCFRNYSATANYLNQNFEKVVLMGATTLGEFREEDQICCSWIANELLKMGFKPKNEETLQIVNKWKDETIESILTSKSTKYLQKSSQTDDLKFIMEHVNDLSSVFLVNKGQIKRRNIKQVFNES